MNDAVLIQALGLLAAGIGVTCYLQKTPDFLKIQAGCSSWVWGIHLGLLGSHSAMLTQFAIGIRSWCSVGRRSARYLHLLFWISSLVFCALAVAGWDGWISLLPLLAAINSTAAMVHASNRAMRIRLLGSSALWIGTGLYWHSWPMVAMELVAVSLNVRSIVRLQDDQVSES